MLLCGADHRCVWSARLISLSPTEAATLTPYDLFAAMLLCGTDDRCFVVCLRGQRPRLTLFSNVGDRCYAVCVRYARTDAVLWDIY
jgi:hypothetical protein